MNNRFNKLLNEAKPFLKDEELAAAIKKLEKAKTKVFIKKCAKKIAAINEICSNVKIPFVIYDDKNIVETICKGLPPKEKHGELTIKGFKELENYDLMYLNTPEYPCLESIWVYYTPEFREYMFLCFAELVNIYGKLIVENKSNIKLKERDTIYLDGEEFVVIDERTIMRTEPFEKANPNRSRLNEIVSKYIIKLAKRYHIGGKQNGK